MMRSPIRSIFVVSMFILGAPVLASGQTIGARAGVSIDPDQFFFGGHVQTRPIAEQLRFQPNVEIGLGDDRTTAAFNLEFVYPLIDDQVWDVYAGAGPALNVISRNRDTDAEAGLNVLLGVAHEGGLFFEFKAGAFDSPRAKFTVGYSWRWQ